MRVETVLGMGFNTPPHAASPDLLVHRVAIVFALCNSLRLSVSPLVGRLERKAVLVFISRSPGSLLRPRLLSPTSVQRIGTRGKGGSI